MAFSSTADLLFNITADTDSASANVEKFRQLNSDEVDQIRQVWESFVSGAVDQQASFASALNESTEAEKAQTAATEQLAEAHGHAVSEIQATSGAIRLLEGSGGLRAMERFVATTLGIGPAMQAIFPIVGAIAFTEVITRMGEKVYDLYKQWDPVNQAEERAAKTAKALSGQIKSLGEEIRRLDAEAFRKAFGEIEGNMNESADIVAEAISKDKVMVANLTAELERAHEAVAKGSKNAQVDLAAQGYGLGQITEKGAEAAKSIEGIEKQLTAFQLQLAKDEKTAALLASEAMEDQEKKTEKAAKAAAKVKEEFFGLSTVLESLKAKVSAGSEGGEWARMLTEVQHYQFELSKAYEELGKLKKQGEISAQTMLRETAALAAAPAMIDRIITETRAKILAEENQQRLERMNRQIEATEREEQEARRAGESLEKIDREISERLATAEEQSWQQQRQRLRQEVAAWRTSLEQKAEAATGEANLTANQYREIDRITADGLSKIDRAQTAAFANEIQKLQQRLDQEVAATQTGQQRLAAIYQKDLQAFNSVEEAKAKAAAADDTQRAQIAQLYDKLRTQLGVKYQDDTRKWAASMVQSISQIRTAMQDLNVVGQKLFTGLAQGMGENIAHAIEFGGSFEKAMKQALASTLDSIAGQSLVQAIYSSALGFLELAEGDYTGAGSAFTAAAIFGSVGGAAAIAGKYAGAGAQTGAGGSSQSKSSGGSDAVSGTGDVSGSIAGGAGTQTGRSVQIVIQGHVIGPSGAAQLADIINQAVYNNDVNLYASHGPTGVPLP